jgi:hypothetical protein
MKRILRLIAVYALGDEAWHYYQPGHSFILMLFFALAAGMTFREAVIKYPWQRR